MISFKAYLTESRSAPLYHGTDFIAIQKIINSGIEPYTMHYSGKIGKNQNFKDLYGTEYAKGVSTTRNLSFAKTWRSGIVLELNQEKLNQKYKIIPYQYWQATGLSRPRDRNEFEEFIMTTKPIPFSYVKRIHIPQWVLDQEWSGATASFFNKLIKTKGQSFIVSY